MELHYRYFFTKSPVLILVHGLLGSAENWRSIGKKWMQAGLQVFAIDQRNHGFSPHSSEHNYTILAQDLREFIQKHQIENPILLGHSMGAKTVMQYVNLYPDQVSKIIIADMAPKAYHHHVKHNATFNALLNVDLQKLTSRKNVELQLISELNKAEKELKLTNPFSSSYLSGLAPFLMKGLYTDITGHFHWRFNISALQNNIDEILSPIIFEQAIHHPVLLLKGGNSNYVSAEDEIDIKKIFPLLESVTLENAGHWLQGDQPEIFYEKVLYFCQKE